MHVTFFLPLTNSKYTITADHGVLPMANEVLMNLGHIIQYYLTYKKEDIAKLLSGSMFIMLKTIIDMRR